ncbi:hypothetical protein [Erwinia amylovora]|uniref:Uncharacterized protein n=3 Tax=Erwinia amylovora TaxID=552 RepID=A0A831ER56_ERWAM|nr:hypothetical protein [Erwinia amylovora]CBX81022.1 hypothetical protein predicted by Glimmer/Critica [Erwinia amylovora ATCC BAA-2158]CCP03563.1 hypothetical protein BN439_2511 [Erwinia amylovora Ea644]CCP07594.1 hypothetical protein BN440_2575 [Erwinia amylovora MR1]CDK15584.1 hypothetical protein LA635_1960 [Erwinia amylovora LA635]CDK18950.1 hypothetical protein LA636_1958 [Erwinia amylovora LA636]CDK22321.1 hypothetical protein LA637_1961 [Erwinia amylovora LA637]
MQADIFEFDIDAELEQALARAGQKAAEVPVDLSDEADCEGCKI